MNTLGLSTLLRLGCLCGKDSVYLNETKFIIKERLGDGGFSTVYLVINSQNHKKFALKRLINHNIDDQKIAMNEINYYKKFKHPNIIELIDWSFNDSGNISNNIISESLLLLTYYKNGTLNDHLTLNSVKKNYLDLNNILRLIMGISDGIQYMHSIKPDPIAHRDLKTANICISDNYDPIIMDLGSCSKARIQICGIQDAQKLQDYASEHCSMTYRPPELFHVESYCVLDERTDIWSLGCLLYALLYFKSPYDYVYERGDSVNLAVVSGNIHFPNTDSEKIPQNFCDVHNLILSMLKINLDERPFINNVIDELIQIRNKIQLIT